MKTLSPSAPCCLSRFTSVARFLGRVRGRDGVWHDGRRRDLVLGREARVRDDRVDAFGRPGIAHRRDAVREPQLVHVVLGHRLPAATELDVPVHIDQARHHRHARRIDHAIGVARELSLSRHAAPRELGRTRRLDRDDRVALDEDVERTARRIPRAIDDVRVADEQTCITLPARRGRSLCVERRGDGRIGERRSKRPRGE